EYERLLVADRAAARCSRNRAVDREPRHRNRDAGGLALHELRDLGPVLLIEDVLLRLELGPEPCFDDIGPRFDDILAHREGPGVRNAERMPGGDDAREALADDVADARDRGPHSTA